MCKAMRKGVIEAKEADSVLRVRWRDTREVTRFAVSTGEYGRASVGSEVEAMPDSGRRVAS
jgi:hypothetical protein